MSTTLTEYKKESQDPLLAGVIQLYLDNAPILEYLAFEDINGGALEYVREDVLPDADFRAVGAKYTADTGTVERLLTSLKIAGGKIEVDRALVKMYGRSRLNTAIRMKVKSMARRFNITFYKGDGTGDSFTGLQSRIGAGQTIENHATGAPLSLKNLSRAVKKCKGGKPHIFCGEDMWLLINEAKQDVTIGGQIMITQDQFGEPITRFAGALVIDAGDDFSDNPILDFSEPNSTTSIYVLGLGDEGVVGIQNGGMELIPLKQGAVDQEWDVEWLVNFIIQNPNSAWRVSNITNATVTS